MIQIIKGDILSADAEALVNTVNCAGVMGAPRHIELAWNVLHQKQLLPS